MIHRIAWAVSRRHDVALTATLAFVSGSFFLSQGFRLRADLPAALFQLLGLWIFLKAVERPRTPGALTAFAALAAAAHLAALLSTPKAFFHLAVSAAFILAHGLGRRGDGRAKFLALALGGPVLLFGVWMIAHAPSFGSAGEFFLASFGSNADHPGFFSGPAFHYVARFVLENPVLVAIFAVGAFSWKRSPPDVRAPLAAAAAVAAAGILLHNERMSFFILSLLPMITVFAVQAAFTRSGFNGRILRYAWPVLMLGNAAFFTARFTEANSNAVQADAVRTIERYLAARPGATSFDATSVLSRGDQELFFVSPSTPGNQAQLMELLKTKKFDVIFLGNRMFFYAAEVLDFLERNQYIQVGPGVFAKATVMRIERPRAFQTVWPDHFCRFDPPDRTLHFYEGDSFVNMRPKTVATQLIATDAEGNEHDFPEGETAAGILEREVKFGVASEFPLVACTTFAPLALPQGLSFAQIFDVDSEY